MYIKEVSLKTNLSKKTIHFYEKSGLISPRILENGYRIYTNDDIERLNKISFLRKLEMPISSIKELLVEGIDEKEILANYKQKFSAKEKEIIANSTILERVVHNNLDTYIPTNSSSLAKENITSVIIGPRYTRTTIFIALFVAIILSYFLMILVRLIFNNSDEVVILFFIALIFFIPFALVASRNHYWHFSEGTLACFPRRDGETLAEIFRQVFTVFITNNSKPFENTLPITELVDAEIIWYPQVSNGFTPEKLSLLIHTIDKETIEIDLMYLKTTDTLVQIAHFLTAYNIPILDPHHIITALVSGKNLYEYLQSIKSQNR